MRAIEIRETGGPEVLQLVERPRPVVASPTDVLVRLAAAGVNPVDTKIRSRGPLIPDGLPMIPGCDGAGVVESVGAQVGGLKPGDAVWLCHGGLGGPVGNYAEYILADAAGVRLKPATLGVAEAAAAPLVLITAWEALFDRGRIAPGQTVLIHAGAGGVGHVAIQLAHLAGARVAATVSGPEKADLVHALGAECAINYREEDLVESVMDWTGGRGVDLAFDTVGPEVFRRTLPAMAHYGTLVTILDPGADQDLKEARNRNLSLGFVLMLTPMLRDLPQARAHQGEILDRCAAHIERGNLRIRIGGTFPLAEAAEAHRHIEAGHTSGKLVLTL